MKRNLKSYPLLKLEKIINDLGYEAYRAKQIFQWLWQKNVQDFSHMTNLSKELKKALAENFIIAGSKVTAKKVAHDGTQKFLLTLEDNKNIEAVLIPEGKRKTTCVSSQVGCPLNCKFCATALLGFKRSLKAYEIADEIQIMRSESGEKITNIVFMGMGEPLLNIKEIFETISTISSTIGLGISQRHTTVSTVGLVDGIEQFLKSPLKVKLAISLNFADETLRKEMMPIAKQNPLQEILRLARLYSQQKTMVTFEYVLIDSLNDHLRDAQRLLKLLKGMPAKINLIPYNPHPLLPYKKPSAKKIDEFYQYLLTSPHTITLRKSHGQEILAACGQLAGGMTK